MSYLQIGNSGFCPKCLLAAHSHSNIVLLYIYSSSFRNMFSNCNYSLLCMLFVLCQVCERALFSLKQLHDQRAPPLNLPGLSLLSPLSDSLTLEEAKLHWECGERTYAMALLKKLLDNLKTVSVSLMVIVLL